jgi:GTP-binding protein
LLKSSLYAAPDGQAGRPNQQTGSNGKDLILHVPIGTEIIDAETGTRIADLNRYDAELLAVRGGQGGLGNQHFATSINQAPTHAQPGMPGEERDILLQLKLLADAGLVGLPNAGKSTLLSAVSHNHPKIADYAFTTLTPNIGVVENRELRRLLLADIPGIIEGASRGHGLGLSFLRHIERVRLIIYVIDGANLESVDEIRLLKSELSSYAPELLQRPALIVINKVDQMNYDLDFARASAARLQDPELWPEAQGQPPGILFLSAKDRRGTEEFVERLFEYFSGPTLAEEIVSGTGPADETPGRPVAEPPPRVAGDIEESAPGVFTHKGDGGEEPL